MSEAMRKLGYQDGYDGNDVRYPSKQDYIAGYSEGYEQAQKDDAFTDEQMRYMENEEFKHEHE